MNVPKYVPDEPIAAVATALAPAALAVVRVSGRGSVGLLANVFSRPDALRSAAGNTLVHGWIVDGGERVDEVLVSVFRAPKSFTGEESAEVSCHGGVPVVRRVLSALLGAGFRRAERGEFTFRAFLHGKADLTRAEAVREIIDARTDAARSRAAGRLSGSLFREISAVRALLVGVLAQVQAEIEYPEDENAIADTFDPSSLSEAERRLSALESSWRSERIFQDGAKVVLAGRTNAGKSSLFNALLKEERAIVSDIAGTTRDYLECWADFCGIPARLFDTAGLRDTDDEIERRGVELSRSLADGADAVLYLVDSSALGEDGLPKEDGLPSDDRLPLEDCEFLRGFVGSARKVPLVLVFSKSDVAPRPAAGFGGFPSVAVSSRTGEGIAELCALVRGLLCGSASGSGERREALGSERQRAAVAEALERVRHALSLPDGFGLDAVSQDVEDALDSLAAVTGETTPDDVLGEVFARFCVGK